MGRVRFGIPEDLALKLRDKFGLRTLVETGTYKAGTAVWAADHFEQAISIEAHEKYYSRAVNAYGSIANLHFVFGDSRTELANVLAGVEGPALLWLDAHWCGNYDLSVGTLGECPIREELAAVRPGDFVLIDDARLFIEMPPKEFDPKQWPTLDEIKRLLPAGYAVFVHEDAIIAVPQRAASLVKAHMHIPTPFVLVVTSNAYLHALPGFAHLFNKFWGAEQTATVMRYEIRPAGLPRNFFNNAVGCQADFTWSSALASWLRASGPDVVILLLEDYYLARPVNAKLVTTLYDYMENHPDVAKIDLSGEVTKRGDYSEYHAEGLPPLVRAGDGAPWQTSLQAAIWRKDYLLRFLADHENPWQFEKRGSGRVVRARKAGTFDGLVLGTSEPVLSYVNAIGGEGNKPGEYDLRKFPQWMIDELQKKGLLI